MSARARGLHAARARRIVASVALVAASIAQGGLDHGKTSSRTRACRARAPDSGGTSGTIERIVAERARRRGLPPARLARAPRRRARVDDGRRRLFGSGSAQDDRIEEAVRSGLRRAIDDAAQRGEVGGLDARAAAGGHRPPPDRRADAGHPGHQLSSPRRSARRRARSARGGRAGSSTSSHPRGGGAARSRARPARSAVRSRRRAACGRASRRSRDGRPARRGADRAGARRRSSRACSWRARGGSARDRRVRPRRGPGST